MIQRLHHQIILPIIFRLLFKVRKNLTDDLLLPKYRNKRRKINSAGHCYVASETLFHLLNGKDKFEYKPYYIKINNQTHWYLMSNDRNQILDPTFDQFKNLPKYTKGKRSAFLTKFPSKRSKILLGRIS